MKSQFWRPGNSTGHAWDQVPQYPPKPSQYLRPPPSPSSTVSSGALAPFVTSARSLSPGPQGSPALAAPWDQEQVELVSPQ